MRRLKGLDDHLRDSRLFPRIDGGTAGSAAFVFFSSEPRAADYFNKSTVIRYFNKERQFQTK